MFCVYYKSLKNPKINPLKCERLIFRYTQRTILYAIIIDRKFSVQVIFIYNKESLHWIPCECCRSHTCNLENWIKLPSPGFKILLAFGMKLWESGVLRSVQVHMNQSSKRVSAAAVVSAFAFRRWNRPFAVVCCSCRIITAVVASPRGFCARGDL